MKRRVLTLYEIIIRPVGKYTKDKVIEKVKYFFYDFPPKIRAYHDVNGVHTETVIDLSKVDYVTIYKNNQFMRCYRA